MFTEEELTEFEQEGSLLIERMELQSGFNPQITDLLIEKSEDLPGIIEVFIDSRVDYGGNNTFCLLYTSPSPRDRTRSRMPSSA